MQEERLQVLRMVAEGKLTAEEGARLLEAVERAPAGGAPGPGPGGRGGPASEGRGRWVRIRVQAAGGRQRVNLRLPVPLVEAAAGIALRLLPRGALAVGGQPVDVQQVLAAIRAGLEGKILELRDEEEDTTVEVAVE